MTYFIAARVAERKFEQDFPGIVASIRPIHAERVVEVTWTDGPTATQVENSLNPHVGIPLRLYRRISSDFEALLADDFEHITGEPYDANRTYAFVFSGHGRIVPCANSVTPGDLLLRRLSQVTSVDGDRCVWSVKS